jgi:hypothetical protein
MVELGLDGAQPLLIAARQGLLLVERVLLVHQSLDVMTDRHITLLMAHDDVLGSLRCRCGPRWP